MVYVAIIGTGDFAHGIAHLFRNYNSESSGNVLAVTKPGLEKGKSSGSLGSFHKTGAPLVDFEEALWRADAIILAIPAAALKAFVTDNIQHLKDKILIDATNSTVRGEDLDAMLCMTNIRWVKAFNDIGAVDVLLNKPYGKNKIASKMCSSHVKSLAVVKKFGETSLGLDVKVIPYGRYADIVMHQNSLGEEWMKAALIMVIILVLTEIYAIMR
jgi:predicted dinucleotide-binding enzyme